MAPLTKDQVAQRMLDIVEAKFDTHKTDIASDVLPIRELKKGPFQTITSTPAVCAYYERHTAEDAPQETGETRKSPYLLEAFVELPKYSDEHCRKATDFADALEWTMKKERELLHPTAGTKLPWLFEALVLEAQIRWLHWTGKTGGLAHIRIPVTVTIDEAENV